MIDEILQNLLCCIPLGTKVYIHRFVGNFMLKLFRKGVHLTMCAGNVLTSVLFGLASILMNKRELADLLCNCLPGGL